MPPTGDPKPAHHTFIMLVLLALFVGVFIAAMAHQQAMRMAMDRNTGEPDVQTSTNIPYGPDRAHLLDIYQPTAQHIGDKPLPVIVFFHGGTWMAGDKESMAFVGKHLADWGYIAVVAGYRLYPRGHFPDFMNDSARALAWVHNNIARYGGDPRAVYAAGHSAGAYNAAMLALDPHYLQAAGGQPDWLRGVISLAGPFDFFPDDADVAPVFAGVVKEAMFPLDFATGPKVPMLLITGDQDMVVPPQDTDKLAAALQAVHSSVTVKIYPGFNHGTLLMDFDQPGTRLKSDIGDFIRDTRP